MPYLPAALVYCTFSAFFLTWGLIGGLSLDEELIKASMPQPGAAAAASKYAAATSFVALTLVQLFAVVFVIFSMVSTKRRFGGDYRVLVQALLPFVVFTALSVFTFEILLGRFSHLNPAVAIGEKIIEHAIGIELSELLDTVLFSFGSTLFLAAAAIVASICSLISLVASTNKQGPSAVDMLAHAVRWTKHHVIVAGTLLAVGVWNYHAWTRWPASAMRSDAIADSYRQSVDSLVTFHTTMYVYCLSSL